MLFCKGKMEQYVKKYQIKGFPPAPAIGPGPMAYIIELALSSLFYCVCLFVFYSTFLCTDGFAHIFIIDS